MNKSSYLKKKKKKKKKKKIKNKKKVFIRFFFRNRKLWSSSTFSSDATSSQLSTLSIHQSMEYVPNLGHLPGMPKSFQWITLLLIESIYFAGIRVKGPHTSVWIIPSKLQIHWTSGKHVQTSNHRISRKHVQISNPSDLWEARLNFKPSNL